MDNTGIIGVRRGNRFTSIHLTKQSIIELFDVNFTYTALRNHDRTVFEEMTSWRALLWYIGMKLAF